MKKADKTQRLVHGLLEVPTAKMVESATGQPRPEGEPEPEPQHYINKLPDAFDPDEAIDRIKSECAYCMDSDYDKAEFMKWIKANENIFPDVAKALEVIERNDSWCTDSYEDMLAFFEAMGYRRETDRCPVCGGTGCAECHHTGTIAAHCVCDETHRHNNSVCAWCNARGRRHFNDPPV